MSRKSSIKQLDPRIKEAVDQAIRDDRATIDDIVAIVGGMGGDASRSAVGRYKQKAEAQMKRYREAQEVAKVWIGKLQTDPEGDVGRLLAEMLRTTAFQTIGDLDAGTPQDIMFLGKALKDLASADTLTANRIMVVRREAAKEAAVVAVKEAKGAGLSDEAAEMIRKKILGVA
ncbi:MAG: phage protein Gp27 family protein [Thiobacillus sp.]